MKKTANNRVVLVYFFFLFSFICSTIVPALSPRANIAHAMQLKLRFAEITQSADIIFIGTVQKQNSRLNELNTMIFTDVDFKDIVIINETDRSQQKASSTIRLTYAGGQVGDRGVTISGMPTFKDGHRYLIFSFDDGKTYANPIVGGSQGLFEVVEDIVSHKEFVLTAGRKAIVGLNDKGIKVSKKRVSHIQDGALIGEKISEAISDRFFSQAPTPSDPADSASLSDRSAERNAEDLPPLSLEEFLNYIRNVALKLPLEKKMLKRNGQGYFFKNNDGKMEVENLKLSEPPVRILSKEPSYDTEPDVQRIVPRGNDSFRAGSSDERTKSPGGTLGACGYHDLYLTMEQVPESWWSYTIFNDGMWLWNQFMDIYRYTDDDGTFNWWNDQNEFAGWVDDDTLYDVYGVHWGGSLAYTISFSDNGCYEIIESDIAFNPAYSWTDDADYALGNSGVKLLRPIAMHELGHSWGEQRGDGSWGYQETYDYDVPSVMHSYHYDLVEDGWGIHYSDAYLIRRVYDDQTSILNTIDVGVESYYASNGLNHSTTDATSYYQKEHIKIFNLTVENMSYSDVSEVTIRFFLSTNRTITTSDHEIGHYYMWTSFPAESYTVVDKFEAYIPEDTPPGTYYLGIIATINGYENDDFTENNTTSLYDTVTILADIPDILHILTQPSDTTVSPGELLGPFYASLTNNTGSYYEFYAQPYFITASGVTRYATQRLLRFYAGETRDFTRYISVPNLAQEGTCTFGVILTETGGNLISDNSFDFTVVSGAPLVRNKSSKGLRRLMKVPGAQVVERDGWKMIIIPKKR